MEFNWPHMAASAVIIAIVLFLLKKTKLTDNAGTGKRVLITAIALFIPLFILNLVWPYSAG
ncbi:hypothetical protein OZN62_08410 [Aurantiacibacter sp. MUD11]|uniref:hypothetical protein n=1 Tax=Aurantiacibacter sp. MUD11 TaxID=3003265 RepID=UPI0022AB21B6|nr:hypothetical protein [Aurantiacibacter sp. MUD11]WAT16962.1 hypothetical protein OZN62_08410 [Aurantiacibacter sp. MUD11]